VLGAQEIIVIIHFIHNSLFFGMSKPVKYFAIFGVVIAVVLIAYNIFLKDKGIDTGSLLVRESTTAIGETAAVTELLIVLRSAFFRFWVLGIRF